MTDYCTIGPISVTDAHLYEGNEIGISGTETFTLICSNVEAKQIMGLAGETQKEVYNTNRLITSKSSWGVVWIDTSSALNDNDYISHRGWYLIHDAVPTTDLGKDYVHLEVTAEKLSSYEHEYLLMDYTPGVNDGTVIDHGYSDVSTVYALQDTFTTYASPTTWAATVKSGMTTGSFSASPAGYLCATGQSNSDGTWNGMYTYTVTELPYPSTLEFDLKYQATPADKSHYMVAYLTPTEPTTYASLTVTSLRILLEVTKAGVYYYITRYSSGTKTHLKKKISLGTNKNPKFKVVAEDGNINIYIDKTAGGTYTKIYSSSLASSGMSWIASNFYMVYQFQNMDSTSATCYSSFCNDYYDTNTVYNNIVSLPCTTPTTTRDFFRPSSDGLIPCYRNPSSELYFWQDYENYYNGAVKGYNSNYADGTPQIITSTDEILTPSKFYVTNGLIKLTTGAGSVTPLTFAAYTSPGGWCNIQTPNVGEINLLKPLYISPERQTYQINDTKWTMSRGKQHVKVEHPYTTIYYAMGSTYYHDAATLTTPSANADVSMLTQYYTNVSGRNNLVGVNVATACSFLNATPGFTPWGSTVTPAIDWTYGSNDRSLQVTTDNLATDEGFTSSSPLSQVPVTPGLPYTGNVVFKGASGTVRPRLVFRNSGGSLVNYYYGTTTTLDGTVKSVTVTGTPATGSVRGEIVIRTPTKQGITFNVGQVIIVEGTEIPNGTINSLTGDIESTPCFQIIQTEPTTIKSDSIPAASITGLGFYETTPPSTYSNYTNIAGEFMKQTSQKVNVRKV